MTLDEAAEQWPEWKLWISGEGALVCATRRRRLDLDEIERGLAPTLIEDDLPTLIESLAEQDEHERALCLRRP